MYNSLLVSEGRWNFLFNYGYQEPYSAMRATVSTSRFQPDFLNFSDTFILLRGGVFETV